jgi:16S rRNA (cytosine967-C5)-methyltransferase
MRRHPEIRWRRTESDLVRSAVLQERILHAAARSVAAGGALVYAVCSPEPEEGEEIVARFLATHPEFTREDTVSTAPPEVGEDAHFGTRMRRTG